MNLTDMLASPPAANGLIKMLLTANKPPEACAKMLLDVSLSQLENPAALHATFTELFKQLKDAKPNAEAEKVKQKYEQALQDLQQGPLRSVTYVGKADASLPGTAPRVEVVTPDGQSRLPTLVDGFKADDLQPGATLFLDAEGATVLASSDAIPEVGPQAKFLRLVPGSELVELQVRDEQFVVQATQPLLEAIRTNQIKRGGRVIYCPRRQFGFRAVAADDDHRHRFVDQASIPAVVASRDIGRPHWALAWLRRRTDILLNRPDLLERFDIRPRVSLAMLGPSGTGKTLTIRAYLHEFSQMLQTRTGRTDIGSRVIRIKTSDLLSPWFGETDQRIDELFTQVMEVGSRKEETVDGDWLQLPVVMILEECEALARRRGDADGGAVYDRVIGTLLQRLDDPTDDLSALPLITISSSNRPDMLDVAMWRRLAGMVARFHRLDREGFHAVLSKKIKASYPFASQNGHAPDSLRQTLIDTVVGWLYSPNIDGNQIEITMRDGNKLQKCRRHFMTGAIVEQAVSEAIDRAAFAAAESGADTIGLSSELIIDALHRQVENLVSNLTAQNVGEYVDLPENAHVADVRCLRPPKGFAGNVVT